MNDPHHYWACEDDVREAIRRAWRTAVAEQRQETGENNTERRNAEAARRDAERGEDGEGTRACGANA